MKIISIVGSPRGKKGNTARLLNEVIKGAENMGAENETIFLLGDLVLPCRGCDKCHVKGYCFQKDKYEEIKLKILKADGLILASPNYIFNVSAQLKSFMDRCCGVLHCMEFYGKYGASIVTSGGGNEKPIADYMNYFLITTGIRPVGSIWATMGHLEDDVFTKDICHKAFGLGEKLVKAWKQKKQNKNVEKKMEQFRQRMQFLVKYRKDDWLYEYNYWKKHWRMP
ncbi:MAG: flavodoxin family protein [Proteobacteria bacterium]|nr:flavodoxin family protein [Pseudomonadota bacterium]